MCTPCFKFVVACAFLAYYYATAACSLVKKFRPVAITFNLNFYYMAETISKPDKANPSFVATQAGKKGPSCPLGPSGPNLPSGLVPQEKVLFLALYIGLVLLLGIC